MKGLHGRRRRTAQREREMLHQESLEPRLAMAVEVFGYASAQDRWSPREVPGRLVIASDAGDDVFIKQVASVNQDLIVSNDASFLSYKTVDNIDGLYDSVFITNGSKRVDTNLLPTGFPNTGDSTTVFSLFGNESEHNSGYGAYGGGGDVRGTITYIQADDSETTWGFTSWNAPGFSSGDTYSPRIVEGPGYGGVPGYYQWNHGLPSEDTSNPVQTTVRPLQAGWVYPESVVIIHGGLNGDLAGHLYDGQDAVVVTWSEPLVNRPTLDITYHASDTGTRQEVLSPSGTATVPSFGRTVTGLTYSLNGVNSSTAGGAGTEVRSLGLVQSTLTGSLATAYGILSFYTDEQGILRNAAADQILNGRVVATQGDSAFWFDQRAQGHGFIVATGSVAGDNVRFEFQRVEDLVYKTDKSGWDVQYSVPLYAVEGSLSLNLEYLVYTQSGTPNEVTMFAGQDFTRELTVDLLTPGSTFNADTNLSIDSGVSGGAGDYDFRATNININASISAPDRVMAGWSSSVVPSSGQAVRYRLSEDETPFETSPTLGAAVPGVRDVRVLPSFSSGQVTKLSVLPGQEGYGYDPDNPPSVAISRPQTTAAEARVVRLSGSVLRVELGSRGQDYKNGADVEFSAPETGAVGRILLNSAGSGYTSQPLVRLVGGGGRDATAVADWDAATGTVTGIRVTNPGRDYIAAPACYIYEPGSSLQTLTASPARGTAVLKYDRATGVAVVDDNNRVVDVQVTNPGSGYIQAPTVTVTGRRGATAGAQAEGTGATATAVFKGEAVQARVFASGLGYVPNSTIVASMRGNDISDVDGVVSFSVDDLGRVRDDQIKSIVLVDGGYGYTARPTVRITGGDDNAGATVEVIEYAPGLYRVTGITLDAKGSGYGSSPIVLIDGPQAVNGSRAAIAIATVTDPVIRPTSPGLFTSADSVSVLMPTPNAVAGDPTSATGSFSPNDGTVTITATGSGYVPRQKVDVYVWGGGSSYADLPVAVDSSLRAAGIRGYFGTVTADENGKIELGAVVVPRDVVKPGDVKPGDGKTVWQSLGFQADAVATVYVQPPAAIAGFFAKVTDAGFVSEFVRLQPGSNYAGTPIVTVGSATKIGNAEAGVVINAATGEVSKLIVTTPGYGYRMPPRVEISPPDEGLGGVQARAVARLDGLGRVIGFDILDAGYGYRSRPTVTIAAVNPRAVVESFNANAAIQANIYEIYIGDDSGTDLDRGMLYVSPTGGLSAKTVTFSPTTVAVDVTNSTLTFQGDQTASVVRGKWLSAIGIPDNTRVTSVKYVAQSQSTIATITPGRLASYTSSPIRVGGGAASSYIEATTSDVYVDSKIEALRQSFLFNSSSGDSQQAPFVFTTRSYSTGIDTGRIIGDQVNIALGNRMPTPLLDASAYSVVDIATEVGSLRVRAGTDPVNPAGAFPYVIDVRELDDLEIAAVAASSMPVRFAAGGSIAMPAGLSTGSDLTIVAGTLDSASLTSFTVQAPISSDFGKISIEADNIGVSNSISVKAAAISDGRRDVELTARRGVMELGGLVSAVNDVFLDQRNVSESAVGGISGNSRIRARKIEVRSEGSVAINTDAEELTGRAETGFSVNEASAIYIPSLTSGGLVSITSNGVDKIDQSTGKVTKSLVAYLTEVEQLAVSTPNGSSEVYVDTQSKITLGDAASIAAGKQVMQAAGDIVIRSNGGDIDVLDAPVAGLAARYVRVATTISLSAASGKPVSYNPGVPGTVAATLSGEGLLPAIDGKSLAVGDRVLVKNQVNDVKTIGINERRENGIYQVTRIGGNVLGSSRWVLTRSADADTSADLPTNTYVRVGEGSQAGKFFQISYSVIPVTLVERTTANQLQLPSGLDSTLTANIVAGQVVTGTGIAAGAKVAEGGVTKTADGRTIVRLERVATDVSLQSPNQSQLTLAATFSGYSNLFVGQRLFGAGVSPNTFITAINAASRQVSVSPGGLPFDSVPGAIKVAKVSISPSEWHSEFFDEYIDLDESFNDFDLIHVGQRVTGTGFKTGGGAVVTGVDPAFRRIGFKKDSIDQPAGKSPDVSNLAFQGVRTVSFGMIQGTGGGYAEFAVKPLGMAWIDVSEKAFAMDIGSDRVGARVNLVVNTSGTTNDAPGSIGKMIALRQSNTTRREMTFAFGTLTKPIRLDQALPPITKPFSIVGNSSVVIDGSRITKNSTGGALGLKDAVNGFEFRSGSGSAAPLPGSTISNLTIGGFARGAAIVVDDAKDILIDRVVLGRGRLTTGAVVPNGNAVGISVSGPSGSATILNSQIFSSKQYRTTSNGELLAGQGVKTSNGGAVTVVGTTIGGTNETNYVGIELSGSGASRVGVDAAPTPRVQATTVAGTSRLALPQGMSADAVHIGQTIAGAGIATGTFVTGITKGVTATWLRLSTPMTRSGSSSLAFGAPARNVIQYSSSQGVRMLGGSSTITNSDIRWNIGDGIRIEGGIQRVGTAVTLRDGSNAIYGNNGLAVNVKKPATIEPQAIQGNFFGGAVRATTGAENGSGDVGIDEIAAMFAATGYNPPIPASEKTVKDKWGNQYLLGSDNPGGPTPTPTPKPGGTPQQPWNAQ